MAWGGYAGVGAKVVRDAFWAGKTRRLGNVRTDGETYFLFDHAIARRRPDDRPISLVVADKLEGKEVRPPFEFSFAGYPTTTTCSHLEGFGLRCRRDQGTPRINGHVVNPSAWYTEESLLDLPTETTEETEKRLRREKRQAKYEREVGAYTRRPDAIVEQLELS